MIFLPLFTQTNVRTAAFITNLQCSALARVLHPGRFVWERGVYVCVHVSWLPVGRLGNGGCQDTKSHLPITYTDSKTYSHHNRFIGKSQRHLQQLQRHQRRSTCNTHCSIPGNEAFETNLSLTAKYTMRKTYHTIGSTFILQQHF